MYNLLYGVNKDRVDVMGDFNFAELDWKNVEKLDASHPFVDCINNNFLFQLVNKPTRGKNYLDLILSSEENMVHMCWLMSPLRQVTIRQLGLNC